jgi:phosphoribosylcarboxyaminoimidazole (NCAIR) mutase
MSRVLFFMGSERDRERMERAVPVMQDAGIEADVLVSSPHREPDRTLRAAGGG